MWMFRIGKLSRWMKMDPANRKSRVRRDASIPHDVESAMKDLVPREEEEVSVYRAESSDEGDYIGLLYAVTVRPRPRDMDFVLLPDDCMTGLDCVQVDSEIGAPFLRERHHEIRGLQAEDRRRALATSVLAYGSTIARRIKERDLVPLAASLVDNDALKSAAKPEWRRLLDG